jgi:uncharacterized LabA/DUF88 family protein
MQGASTPPAHFGGRVQGSPRGSLGFSGDEKLRTTVYVDGFNLYYRALRKSAYRWLDLLGLSRALLGPNNEIDRIRYFTARISPTPQDPQRHTHQDAYLRALQAHIPCVAIHEGNFQRKLMRMPLDPPIAGKRTAQVIKTEEKGSDVNLAVHLLNDAWSNAFDVALVISNDSDLAEAIALAAKRGLPVGVANPCQSNRMNARLHAVATFRRQIERKHLSKSLLPDPIPGTTISKPPHW